MLLAATSVVTLSAFAPAVNQFTAAEQQQINISTPHLFDKKKTFETDFTQLKDNEYSFPLPVGKPKTLPNLYMEIATKKGDVVKAMFGGVVRLSRKFPEYGHVVVVRHPNGLETVYGNNAQNLVKVGETVTAGQTLAIVGERGGRAYCSFAIMVDGKRIRPEIIIESRSHQLRRRVVQFTQKGRNVDVAVLSEPERPIGVDSDDPFAHGDSFQLNLAEMEKSGQWGLSLAWRQAHQSLRRQTRS